MNRSYVLVTSEWDGSGIGRAFGPYDTEEAAKAAQPDLQELCDPHGSARWDVLPMYTITTAPEPAP